MKVLNGMISEVPAAYEFADFHLDPAHRRLLRSGEPVPLTPKVFDTLLYLVEHRHTVLEKDELLKALWPDVVVEENNLGQAISKLRAALGEAPGANRYIATITGRGYRFVAPVTPIFGPDARPLAREEAPDSAPRLWQVSRLTARGSLLVAVATLVVLTAAYLWRARVTESDERSVGRLAVLPFKPLVPEVRNEAMEYGIADILIARLAELQTLTVSPLSVVRRYADLRQNPIAAGRELGVDAVLDGHIYRAGDRIRVSVRLVRVADEKQLWANQYDEPFTSVFAIQDAIAQQVTRSLAIELSPQAQQRTSKSLSDDPVAYELYLKGRFFMSLAQPRQAIRMFEQAVARDAEFALAHAGLADIYSRLPIATDGPSREAIERARDAAVKALAVDNRLAEAYTALGWIGFYHDWDWTQSEKHFTHALTLNRRDFSAHLGYAHLLSNTYRLEEALKEIDAALALDPVSPIAATLKGQFLLYGGRHDESRHQVRQTLTMAPGFWIAQLQLGRIHLQQRRYEDALAAFSTARQSGGSWAPLALIGYTHARADNRADANRVLGELTSASRHSYVPPYYIALVHNGLSQPNEALDWLERGYEERDVRMVFLGVDPAWDSLRGLPRFNGLLKQMNLSN